MDASSYKEYGSRGYNRVPLVREMLADIETPLSCYLKTSAAAFSFLFESVQGGETWGRYSIIGLPAREAIRINGAKVQEYHDGQWSAGTELDDPLTFVREYQTRFRVPELADMPVFHGGLVGFFAYDTVRFIEPRLATAAKNDELGHPEVMLLLVEELIVFDNLSGSLKIIVHGDPNETGSFEAAQRRIEEITAQIQQHSLEQNMLPLDDLDMDTALGRYSQGYPQQEFMRDVERIKEYILAGDCMQVVLSQRLSADFDADAIDIYRALRFFNPSPYMYTLNMGDFQIVGSSPEILARLEQDKVTVRPIAGTLPRGGTAAEDKALERQLLDDPKERAEHLMLIDLGRNDVGRIANTGTVRLEENMIVEYFSHVMHIVSTVTGQLNISYDAIDVLRACLPAGTLSGAPKLRAMEIIDELEPSKRGIYGGAIGYISWQGDMDTAIAIRTAVVENNKIHIQAGAGIVADSDPQREWEECMNKAGAVVKAAHLARLAEKQAK